jgi:hypothetical protein
LALPAFKVIVVVGVDGGGAWMVLQDVKVKVAPEFGLDVFAPGL